MASFHMTGGGVRVIIIYSVYLIIRYKYVHFISLSVIYYSSSGNS